MNPHKRLLVLTLGLSVITTACTSLRNVQEFGKAARTVSESAAAGYKDFDDLRTTSARETKVIKGVEVTKDDLKRLFDGKTDGGKRLSALKNLANYATALEALASRDATPEIKAAALDIKTSLTSLNSAVGGQAFSPDDIGTIGALVAVVVDVYVDVQREKALRSIVLSADSGVQKVIHLLKDESPEMAKTLESELAQGSQRCLEALGDTTKAFSLEERREIATLAQQLQDNSVLAPQAIAAVAQAASKMGAAHSKLALAARSGKLTTKETFAAIGEFTAKAEAVRDLFNEVKAPGKK